MTKVFKYELQFDQFGKAVFWAPAGRALKVANQAGHICVWIEHDPSNPKVEWVFRSVMTGEELPTDFTSTHSYVDTVFKDWLVVHIYESMEKYRA